MSESAEQAQRRKPRENQYLFDLGVRGRKTGVTLPDTGIRDEHGLEPMDHLFSSPEKLPANSPKKATTGRRGRPPREAANTTLTSEEDMDIGESTIPDPIAVVSAQRRSSVRLPPRAKSPIKTFLKSPARRNPSLGPISSPTKNLVVSEARAPSSVRRRLDFSIDDMDKSITPATRNSARVNGRGSSQQLEVRDSMENQIQAEVEAEYQDDLAESTQEIPISDEPEPEPEAEDQEFEEPEPVPVPVKAAGARSKGKQPMVQEPATTAPAAKRGKGRPPKRKPEPVVEEEEEEEEEVTERPSKRPRPSPEARKEKPKAKMTTQAPKSRVRALKEALPSIEEDESVILSRAPPPPRNKRGLFILRRETPMDGSGFTRTRSGRNSVKPLAYWKNERIEYEEDEQVDKGSDRFLLSRIKDVVRAVEVTPQKRPRGKIATKGSPKGSRKGKTRTKEEPEDENHGGADDSDAESWEGEPGRVVADVREWDPNEEAYDWESGIPGQEGPEEREEVLAWSSAAMITRDVPAGTFKFAKTITMPFFGTGVVDLAPGGIKRPKNSRRMQMVFFVFYGRVTATVNGAKFGIGRGGMWQVPRGNFYSIENESDRPARIFFSQGCEVVQDADSDEQ